MTGQPAHTAAFTSYCRQRLTDDPHLRPAALLQELISLGYQVSSQELNETRRAHSTRIPCQHCAIAPAYPTVWAAPLAPAAQPLPIRVPPFAGELLASYLARVAAANHLTSSDLAGGLPGWLNRRIWNHNYNHKHDPHGAAATSALHRLAAVTGTPAAALARALPVFGGGPASPARATIACRRCTAARGIHQLIPVHLPAWQQICARHGMWLSTVGQRQLDVTACPEIIAAQHHARRLLRHRTPQQLLLAQLAASTQTSPVPAARPVPQQLENRVRLLMTANPRMSDQAARRELTRAAAYPHTIELATAVLTRLSAPG